MTHALLDETVAILGDLVAFPTVSSESNLELIAHLNERIDQLHGRTRLTLDASGTKANLFATFGPASMDGGIVLSGHTDVVPVDGQDWTDDPFVLRVEGGRAYGRGACDMKGFLACLMAMAPRFAEAALELPVHFAFSYDEEVGCLGAQRMLADLAETGPKPAVAIIGEPTEMGIIEGHKGCCEYTTSFTGLEGHGSQPARGVNAVEYAARYAGRLMEIGAALEGRAPAGARFDPPYSTIQIGRMTGGTARNVIAGTASLEWELRPVTEADFSYARGAIEAYAAESLLPAMRRVHPEADLRTEVVGEVAGLEPVPDNAAEKLVRALTGNVEPASCVSFGTEAGLFQRFGVATIVCGPGSITQAHKADEFIELAELDRCLGMLDRLLERVRA